MNESLKFKLTDLIPPKEETFATGVQNQVRKLFALAQDPQSDYHIQPTQEGAHIVSNVYHVSDMKQPIATYRETTRTNDYGLQQTVTGKKVQVMVSERVGGSKITTQVNMGQGTKPWISLTYREKLIAGKLIRPQK